MWQPLGQHFLSSRDILQKILQCIYSFKEKNGLETCIEIWPWTWILTRELAPFFSHVYALEIDKKLAPTLARLTKQYPPVTVLRGDVLQQKIFSDVQQDNRSISSVSWKISRSIVLGNLPYYITSPIFRKMFLENCFLYGVFLIQHDVGIKLASSASKKNYLRWLLNNEYQIQYEFLVPPSAFSPPPKVDSCVISLVKRETSLLSWTASLDRLRLFLDIVSPFKRKTLAKIRKMREKELETYQFVLPQSCAWKRLEEVTRQEMQVMIE